MHDNLTVLIIFITVKGVHVNGEDASAVADNCPSSVHLQGRQRKNGQILAPVKDELSPMVPSLQRGSCRCQR